MLKPKLHVLDRVLPVIDLKRGQVVHAIAGQRDRYQPLRSQIVDSFHPGRVAAALRKCVGNSQIYVADLDAIEGQPCDFNSYELITNTGARPWIDAGTVTSERISRLISRVASIGRVVVGLESLESLRDLETILNANIADQLTFSLDLRDGLPITSDRRVQRMSAESIAAYAIEEGIRSIIVLDLVGVGTMSGGDAMIDLCRQIRSRHLDIDLISGGGVRSIEDVERFVQAGCDHVLVSTAIHQGLIGR